MDISAGPTRARQKWRGGRVLERARGARIPVGDQPSSVLLPSTLPVALPVKCIEKPNHGLINQEIARLLIASRRHRETLGEPRQRTDVTSSPRGDDAVARARRRACPHGGRISRERRAFLAFRAPRWRSAAPLASRAVPGATFDSMPVVLRRSSRDRSSPPAASPAPRSRAPARVVVPSRPRTTSTTPPAVAAGARARRRPRVFRRSPRRGRDRRGGASRRARTPTAAATSPTSSARRRTRASRGSSASARRRSPERWRTRRSSATTT